MAGFEESSAEIISSGISNKPSKDTDSYSFLFSFSLKRIYSSEMITVPEDISQGLEDESPGLDTPAVSDKIFWGLKLLQIRIGMGSGGAARQMSQGRPLRPSSQSHYKTGVSNSSNQDRL